MHVHSCITWAMAAKEMVQSTGCIEMLLIDKLSGAKYSFKHQLYHTHVVAIGWELQNCS